jgi:hypothetical protein
MDMTMTYKTAEFNYRGFHVEVELEDDVSTSWVTKTVSGVEYYASLDLMLGIGGMESDGGCEFLPVDGDITRALEQKAVETGAY